LWNQWKLHYYRRHNTQGGIGAVAEDVAEDVAAAATGVDVVAAVWVVVAAA
jgi:hypothetical protein